MLSLSLFAIIQSKEILFFRKRIVYRHLRDGNYVSTLVFNKIICAWNLSRYYMHMRLLKRLSLFRSCGSRNTCKAVRDSFLVL